MSQKIKSLKNIFSLSRPRFWLYTVGAFCLPIFSNITGSQKEWPLLLLGFLYFTFPANIFIYGINDIFDQETDALNPKKDSYESRLKKENVKLLILIILLTNIPFVVALLLLAPRTIPALLAFLFLGAFYSAPPIRAKAIPFFDGIFNALYVMPAVVSALIFPDSHISLLLVVAGTMWCMAMHAFSAIPDISADRQAKIKTVATRLGYNRTLLYCAALWILASLLTFFHNFKLGYVTLLLLPMYLILLFVSRKPEKLFLTYKFFPFLNGLAGAVVSLYLLVSFLK